MKMQTSYRYMVPIGVLVLLVLNFGLLIPELGFYWDDWPVILTGRLQGIEGYRLFYQYDRPFSAWTYIATYPILGDRPINWHIFSLLLRWGTTAALWWTLIRVWPAHRREAAWTTGLFAIYPVFMQQQISVAYSQHWICYLFFFLSFGLMGEAQRLRQKGSQWYWPLTGVAMAFSLVQLLTMEYFAGLELLRPILLWIIASGDKSSVQAISIAKKSLKVARDWLPYLLVLGGFSIWRLYFLDFPGAEANPPLLLYQFFSAPASASVRFFQIALQDTIHLLISVWANIMTPAKINLSDRFTVIAWGWAVVISIAAFFILRRMRDNQTSQGAPILRWSIQALVTGMLAILLGMLPVWFTDRQIIVGTYSNRFGLPAMLGASLVIVGLLEEVIARKTQKAILLAVLFGLAAGQHLQTANAFRWSWIRQTNFYWNFSWRIPRLEPGTAIAAEGEIFPYVGLYSTSAGINLLYPPTGQGSDLPYWFYSLGRNFAYDIESFQQGMPLNTKFRHYQFTGNSKNVLVIYSKPTENDCLHVLAPEDFSAPDLPEISVKALVNSNLSRIQAGETQGFPPEEIFGPEPARGWCYLYQKAALAQQLGQWDEVLKISDQAREQGYSPQNPASDTGFEWLPFVKAYTMKNRWEEAKQVSLEIFAEARLMDGRLCDFWETTGLEIPESRSTADEMMEILGCP